MSRPKKYLPFDQVVEERRAKRFDEHSPARDRETLEYIAAAQAKLRQRDPALHEVLKKFRRQRKRPETQELINSWTRAVDMLEDATDLVLERFNEAAIVTACTSVEVIVGGLLKHHLKATHFTRNRKLGDQVVDNLLRNGFRDRIPVLFHEAWGIDLKTAPEWKQLVEVYQWRNQIVHGTLEAAHLQAFYAVFCATRLVALLNLEIQSRAQSDRSIPQTWGILSADTTATLDDLEEIHGAVFDYLERVSSRAVESPREPGAH